MPLARGIFFMYKTHDYFDEFDTIKNQLKRTFFRMSLNYFKPLLGKAREELKYG